MYGSGILPVETAVAVRWVVCASSLAVPSLWGVHVLVLCLVDVRSDVCPTEEASRYTGSLSPDVNVQKSQLIFYLALIILVNSKWQLIVFGCTVIVFSFQLIPNFQQRISRKGMRKYFIILKSKKCMILGLKNLVPSWPKFSWHRIHANLSFFHIRWKTQNDCTKSGS